MLPPIFQFWAFVFCKLHSTNAAANAKDNFFFIVIVFGCLFDYSLTLLKGFQHPPSA
jgi:hypothetical protein